MREEMPEIKKAYLTIDDSPSADFRVKIDYLCEKRIPALLFCQGNKLLERKSEVIRAIDKGFAIGNHGFEHRYFSELTLEECISSIQKTDEVIESIYQARGQVRPGKFFRFPYFDQGGDLNSNDYESKWSKPKSEWFVFAHEDKRLQIQAYLRELGYRQPRFEGVADPLFRRMAEGYDVYCTFDQMEYWLDVEGAPWGLDREEAIMHRIDEDVPEEGRGLNRFDTRDVILVHDHERTTGLFFRIIDRYLEKNIQFLKAW